MLHGLYDIKLTDSAGNATIKENILIGTEVYKEDFNEFNYTSKGTKLNSCKNSVLNVTSTDSDPKIYMNNVTSFNPKECRYIEIKYKTTSNDKIEIFMIENPIDQTYSTGNKTLVNDGQWHTIVLDLWENNNIKNREKITGWRLDWGNNKTGISMEIDYIRVIK